MRTLPRLLAVTTDAICRSHDFTERAAAIAAAGEAALVVRAPESSAAQHAGFVERAIAAAGPGGGRSSVIVHGRPDLARAAGAQGVQLRRNDLAPADARRVLGPGWIGVSIQDATEAEAALGAGADYLVAGNVFATPSHPGRPAKGVEWLRSICALGRPVIAIGGMTPARVAEVKAAGAWGAAAISALWGAADSAAATRAMLTAWNATA